MCVNVAFFLGIKQKTEKKFKPKTPMLNVNANMKNFIKEMCDSMYENFNVLITEVKNIPSEL